MNFEQPLVSVAVIQPLFLAGSWAIGSVSRALLRRRITVSGATMTVVSVLGTSLGMLLSALLLDTLNPWNPLVVAVVVAIDVAVLSLSSAFIWAYRVRREAPPVLDQIADGESRSLEFKSSARWNLRTHQKDPRMELAVAKAASAFLNSSGGTLIIGVDDDGTMLGLASDFATLRSVDQDRYELWLRDMWHTKLGANAAGQPIVDFFEITSEHVAQGRAADGTEGSLVCRVICPPSPQPVFLRDGPTVELWVRVGNSTRSLTIDDAAHFIRHRWPHSYRPGAWTGRWRRTADLPGRALSRAGLHTPS